MKLYKYKDLFALLATIGWMSFVYSAFKGFHFWYLGFVFFFWLSLGILNYRHETTLWLMRNRWSLFFKYYSVLVILGFVADYIIGQILAGSWVYPFYNSISDWLRLYILIYPFGGLSVVELTYFLAAIFKEKVVLTHENIKNLIITKLEFLTDVLLVFIIFFCFLFKSIISLASLQSIFIILFSAWAILTTFKLKHLLKHFTHWVAIIFAVAILSIFLHEIPNTAVYEWRYFAPALFPRYSFFGIELWLLWGWYFLVLVMIKYWIIMVLLNKRE